MADESNTARNQDKKLQRRLAECFERGRHVMALGTDYDYAHTLFAECALTEPGNTVYVETMLANLRSKFLKQRKGKRLFSRDGSRTLSKAVEQQQWKQVLREGIGLLQADPGDKAALLALARACAEMHHNEAELVYLKQALDGNPKDVQVNKHCALSLGRMGQFDQAIACWHRIEKISPDDAEPARMIIALSEEKLKYPGGRPASVRVPPVAAAATTGAESPAALELELSPEQRLEYAIGIAPDEKSNYLKLAELLAASSQFEKAEVVLVRGLAHCGDDPAMSQLLLQMQEKRQLRLDELPKAAQLPNVPASESGSFRMPWLEIVLAVAVVALCIQLFPKQSAYIWKAADVRQWTRSQWWTVNLVGLGILLAIRFGPDLLRLFRVGRRPMRPA